VPFLLKPICGLDIPYCQYARRTRRFQATVKEAKIQTDPLPGRRSKSRTASPDARQADIRPRARFAGPARQRLHHARQRGGRRDTGRAVYTGGMPAALTARGTRPGKGSRWAYRKSTAPNAGGTVTTRRRGRQLRRQNPLAPRANARRLPTLVSGLVEFPILFCAALVVSATAFIPTPANGTPRDAAS
jgi:hypothetical protein